MFHSWTLSGKLIQQLSYFYINVWFGSTMNITYLHNDDICCMLQGSHTCINICCKQNQISLHVWNRHYVIEGMEKWINGIETWMYQFRYQYCSIPIPAMFNKLNSNSSSAHFASIPVPIPSRIDPSPVCDHYHS